jgi:hypothetical protein
LKSLSSIIFLVVVILKANAQIDSTSFDNSPNDNFNSVSKESKFTKQEGKLNLNIENKVVHLITMYNDNNKSSGYKVQLYSGKSKLEATKIKSELNNKYPDELSSVIIYKQPNFKLRAGNFRDRLTAIKYLEILKVEFPSAFIVQDEIQVTF